MPIGIYLHKIGKHHSEEAKRKMAKSHIKPIRQRFWKKVNIKDLFDCWEWLGYKNPDGYGIVMRNSRKELTHRTAWILTYGNIPENLCVCHKCDNPSCVNPAHLFIGTMQDNVNDMFSKGRQPYTKGSKGGRAILTEEQILAIRILYQAGIRQCELGRMYNIDVGHLWHIINRDIWTHI